jgi:hypothetical protein
MGEMEVSCRDKQEHRGLYVQNWHTLVPHPLAKANHVGKVNTNGLGKHISPLRLVGE